MVAEKLVTEEDEETGAIRGPLSSGSLHSMGTHDSSSSLDWAMDGTVAKAVSFTFHELSHVPSSGNAPLQISNHILEIMFSCFLVYFQLSSVTGGLQVN